MPTANVRDIDMYYRVHGRENGEPLVLLHAYTETGDMFRPFLEELGAQYRLYVPDWRGHGRTRNPKGEILHRDLGQDAAAFAQAIGLERAHFCGVSSGGMQLTFPALDHPQLLASLTYVAATYSFDQRAKTLVRRFADATTDSWLAALRRRHGRTQGEGYEEEIIERWVESVQRADELPFTPADLKRIECPTLIIHGDRDSFFPVRIPVSMYQLIPSAELCILPHCGHNVTGERPRMFLAALLRFLEANPIA